MNTLLIALGLLAGFCVLSVRYNNIECANISKVENKNTQYNALTGCLIEYRVGKWRMI